MSKILHAKPAWGWSVVLLSTLLLSPVAGTAALQALLLAQAQAAAAAQTPTGAAPSSGGQQPVVPPAPSAPRRADEGWMVRLRVHGARPFTLRLDAHPDVVAILVPARAVLLVPDDGAPVAVASAPVWLPVPPCPAATAPRAPPFVSPRVS